MLRRPILSALLIAALSVLAIVGASRVAFDDALFKAFAGESRAYQDFLQNRSRFTQTDTDIAVLFRAPSFADADGLAAVRSFALEAAFADNVSDVYSVFSLRTPPDRDGGTRPVLAADLTEAGDLAPVLRAVRSHPLGGGRLMSQGLDMTMVLVTLDPARGDTGAARETLRQLAAIADETVAGSGIEVSITGFPPLRQAVLRGLLQDTLVLNAIGVAIGFLVCTVALRSVALAVLTMLPAAIALGWAIGAMGWLGQHINTLTNTVPLLVLVLSVSDSLHLTFEVRRQWPRHCRPIEAIAEAERRIAPACLLTSLTTAFAFAALLVSDSELVRSLGWAGATATLLSVLVVLAIHPLVFLAATRLPVLARTVAAPKPTGLSSWRVSALPLAALRMPVAITLATAVLLSAALAGYATIEPVYSFLENIDEGDPVHAALMDLEDNLAPTGSIDIPVDLTPHGGLSEGALTAVGRVQAAVEAALPGAPVVSLDTAARWVGSGGEAVSAAKVEDVLEEMSAVQRARFLTQDDSYGLVRVFVSDEGARAMRRLVAELEQSLERAGPAAEAPTGLLAMSASVSRSMILHLNACFALAVAASGLFIAVWFGNWRYGLIALVPNVLPIACVGAWLAVTDRGLHFASALALTIAFGIAVDDTIHVLNRLRLVAPRSDPFAIDAIRTAFVEISPVLAITTAVLSFGMLGTQFSTVPSVSYFGVLTIAVFVLALIAVLLILPAFLATCARLSPAAGKARK